MVGFIAAIMAIGASVRHGPHLERRFGTAGNFGQWT